MNYRNEPSDAEITDHVRRTLTAAPIGDDTRQQIWEDVMHAATAPLPGTTSTTEPKARVATPRGGGGFTETRFARAVVRWQGAVSLAVVVAVLVSLMGIAWQRGILDGPPPTPEGQLPAMGQSATPDDLADILPDCVAQEHTSRTNEELLSAEFLDFPIPNYSSASTWGPEELSGLYDVSTTFWSCMRLVESIDTADPNDPVYSFLSERLRYILMADQLPADQRAAVDTYLARNPIQTIISNFPLPLNSFAGNSYFPTDGDMVFIYGLFDRRAVFHVPSGGWAATMGGVSTHLLQTGEPVRTGDGEITFIVFVQEGDAWMVDEFFMICPSDFSNSLNDTPTDTPFDPAQLLRQPFGCS